MKTFKLYESSLNERYIDQLVDIMRSGGVIIYPTDSLYAIGCDALNNRAVERVCQIRNINPSKQRLSMVCSGISQASEFARIDNEAFRLMRSNLPGPFTFILPASPKLAKAFKGRKEVGVRVPNNAIARHLAEALGNPLLSASADWQGAEAEQLESPDEIMIHFESADIDAMADGGAVSAQPSAIVSLIDSSDPQTLREGPLPLRY